MRRVIFIAVLIVMSTSAFAQKWYEGHFTDRKGNREDGFIDPNPGGKGPVKDEAFIAFRDGQKTNPFKLSASDIQSFVIGRDSFVVAHAPGNSTWSNREFDFVKVALDEPVKLYVSKGGTVSGKSRGFGSAFHPTIGTGIGTGGYGTYGGVGGGVEVPIGGGGYSDGGKTVNKITFYYGENTANMREITPENFRDVMSDIMGDYPDIVDDIQENKYNLGNIDKLINRYLAAKAGKK